MNSLQAVEAWEFSSPPTRRLLLRLARRLENQAKLSAKKLSENWRRCIYTDREITSHDDLYLLYSFENMYF